MKKALIALSLVALIIAPLIMAGCSCGGGATLTESDIATIQGFGARLDSHDQSIATINSTLNKLDTETLNALAALDASELTALLSLNLNTTVSDVTTLKNDVSTIKGTTIPGILARLEVVENGQGGSSSNGDSNPDGAVVVELDVDDPPYTFTTGSTAVNQVVPVKITNGTEDYYEVMFNVTFRCVTSSDYEAEVSEAPIPSLDINGVPLDSTPVSSWAECRYIYFMWVSTDTILVTPGKTTTVYIYVSDFTTSANEVWQASLSDILATEL